MSIFFEVFSYNIGLEKKAISRHLTHYGIVDEWCMLLTPVDISSSGKYGISFAIVELYSLL